MMVWILISVFGGAMVGFATAVFMASASRSDLISGYERHLSELIVENKMLRTACEKMKREIEGK